MITRAQKDVLRMLMSGPKQTSRSTHHEVVSGFVAASLEKKRYVERVMIDGEPHMRITQAGRDAEAYHTVVDRKSRRQR